jgi:hypothetical protein
MKKFIWCLHCERTFLETPEYDGFECEYPDCDGHIGDLWDWKSVRQSHPEYPASPQHGKTYPL